MASSIPKGEVTFKEAYRCDFKTYLYPTEIETLRRSISAITSDSNTFYIGTASNDNLKSRWDDVCKKEKMKFIFKIYECADKDRRDKFYFALVDFYKAVEGFSHGHCGAGRSPYCIYLACDKKMVDFVDAYQVNHHIISGGWQASVPKVKEFVIDKINERGNKGFWIGVTSGGQVGCQNRWNVKYKWHRMDHMTEVYTTDSSRVRGKMEAALIRSLKGKFPNRCKNVNKGGGGSAGEAPYIVYVAWQI